MNARMVNKGAKLRLHTRRVTAFQLNHIGGTVNLNDLRPMFLRKAQQVRLAHTQIKMGFQNQALSRRQDGVGCPEHHEIAGLPDFSVSGNSFVFRD